MTKEETNRKAREYRAANPDKVREWYNNYRAKNPEKVASWTKYRKTHEVARRHFLKHTYNLTPEDYEKILLSQDGVCKICGDRPDKKRLHVDHDHITGKVRGLPCFRCNSALGNTKESPPIIKNLFLYVIESRLKKEVCRG